MINNQMAIVGASDSLKCKVVTARNMEKRSRYSKEKMRAKKEEVRHRKEFLKPVPRDRTIMILSQRSPDKDANYTPLNSRCENILKEVYHLKLLPIPGRPK